MVFFVISGYCISASAESCRLKGVGPAGYMWRRMRRIYPPYFFSICYFVLTRLWKIRQGLGDQLSHSPLAWIQNLTLTQWLSLVRHPVTSAFDNQTLFIAGYWSLNYEEQFYIVVGVLLLRASLLSRELKSFILVLMVPAFVWNLLHPSICYGFFLEYYFSFGLGAMVFYRLCRIATPQIRRLIDASGSSSFVFSFEKLYEIQRHSFRLLRVDDCQRVLYFSLVRAALGHCICKELARSISANIWTYFVQPPSKATMQSESIVNGCQSVDAPGISHIDRDAYPAGIRLWDGGGVLVPVRATVSK